MNESEAARERPRRDAKQTGLLIFLMILRTIVNTLHRMVYPFLPVFSRELGVSPTTFTSAIAFRSLSGMASPALARLADSRGRKFGMFTGMVMFVAGAGVIVLWPRFDVFVFGLFLASLGKYTLDPAIQAFIGDEIPMERRGEAIAILELGWSMSYLVGGLAVGRMLMVANWDAPFLAIGMLAAVSLAGIVLFIPPGRRESGPKQRLWLRVRSILSKRSARYGLFVGFAVSAANELLSVTFGVWLEDAFQMQLAALASAALVIGLSELVGESLVGFFTDKLGAIQAVRYGVLVNSLLALLLPLIARTQAGAYAGLFLFYLTFEFLIVSSISMITSLETNSRATLMGMNIASISLGRVVAAQIGLQLYAVSFLVVLGSVVVMNLAGVTGLQNVRLAND